MSDSVIDLPIDARTRSVDDPDPVAAAAQLILDAFPGTVRLDGSAPLNPDGTQNGHGDGWTAGPLLTCITCGRGSIWTDPRADRATRHATRQTTTWTTSASN